MYSPGQKREHGDCEQLDWLKPKIEHITSDSIHNQYFFNIQIQINCFCLKPRSRTRIKMRWKKMRWNFLTKATKIHKITPHNDIDLRDLGDMVGFRDLSEEETKRKGADQDQDPREILCFWGEARRAQAFGQKISPNFLGLWDLGRAHALPKWV